MGELPSRESDAVKPRQLDVAQACGLRVPRTRITNRPADVRAFAGDIGGPLATKNLSGAAIVEAGGVRAVFTRRLRSADLDDLRGVEATAHLFQEYVGPKAFEARITVVGRRTFGAAIHAGSEAAGIDFRADYDHLSHTVVEPPADVIAG